MIFKSIKLAENQNFHNLRSLTCGRNSRDVACNVCTRHNYTSISQLLRQ
ncbi:MAG: hypothetical protein LBG92_01860 [Prevotellaceae bacterium]|nr:hypothetical protein [Prevotellaceae bacterium]